MKFIFFTIVCTKKCNPPQKKLLRFKEYDLIPPDPPTTLQLFWIRLWYHVGPL